MVLIFWLYMLYLLYLPQMWSMKTQAMKRRDITKTGTGPTYPLESES